MTQMDELIFDTSICISTPIHEFEAVYTITDCINTIHTSERKFLEQMLVYERVVANHKLKNRTDLPKRIIRDIEKLKINKNIKKNEVDGLENLKQAFGKPKDGGDS